MITVSLSILSKIDKLEYLESISFESSFLSLTEDIESDYPVKKFIIKYSPL